MRQFLNSKPPSNTDIINALLDFGFYHPLSDVQRMYAEYTNHGHLGYAGGVMDQPEEYWHDMDTMRWLELWIKHVAGVPRLKQIDVFESLRKTGQLNGEWEG